MIQTGTIHRARPKCTHCGWVGDWRSSSRRQQAATDAATADLKAHSAFWHPENP